MKLFYSFVIIPFLSIQISFSAEKEPWKESFSREKERERVIGLMTNYPTPEMDIIGLENAPKAQKDFLTHFQKNIWPQLKELPELTRLWWDPPGGRIEIYNNAVNRALYDSPEEEKQWEGWQSAMEIRYRKVLSSKKWQSDVKKWADLSGGLAGELPDLARRMRKDLENNEFTAEEMPLQRELAKLDVQMSKLTRHSQFKQTLATTEKLSNDIVKNFFDGKYSFSAAWKIIEALRSQGRIAYGRDIAEQGRELFQRAAEIRTELAHRKGYKTWAQYILSTYARHHSEGLKTVDDWNRMLAKVLKDTEQPYREFIKKRMKEFGVNPKDLRSSQLAFLTLPAESRIKEYFPLENIEKVWRATMLESGFPESRLNAIHADLFSREEKHSHAYHSYNVPSRPKIIRIVANDLKVLVPDINNANEWIPIGSDIVEDSKDDGIGSVSTLFHEGGHGFHAVYESPNDIWGNGNSNAYSETHSMTMEKYFSDVEFLLKVGKTRDGKKLERADAEKAVMESDINGLSDMRRTVAMTLFDLHLWDYEYGSAKPSFVDRALALYGEYSEAGVLVKPQVTSEVDQRYGLFATGHFYSGDCRYWGYVGGLISSEMIYDALLDHLEKTTGRRSVVDQPGIASFLVDGIYNEGFKLGFPGAVEKLAGAKFSPDALAKKMVKAVREYKTCKADLKKLILK